MLSDEKIQAITHLLALASSLESEGQYNNAKLLRAAVDSMLTRAAYQQKLPADKASLITESDRVMATLQDSQVGPELIAAHLAARDALAAGRLPGYSETPDPYVCRICGDLFFDIDDPCPTCGSIPDTFKRYRPNYWIEALDPFESLLYLRSTPEKVASFLEKASRPNISTTAETEGWSLRQAISHLRDAQLVFAYRVDLILDQENPLLEAKAVFDWADHEKEGEVSVQEIFEDYRSSRKETVERLAGISLTNWWRTGRHEEFGELKLFEQVSYFASHELTHLPQIERLAAAK
jgi:rubrerythrin